MRIKTLLIAAILLLSFICYGEDITISKTGQNTIYQIGDDGDLQKGADIPNPRFIDNGDGTVTDRLTGLMWLKDAACIGTNYSAFDNDGTAGDGQVSWEHAFDFVEGVNNGTYPNCAAGYNNWRIPNKNELKSLIDYENNNPALQAGHPFLNANSWFWTSTTYKPVTTYVWTISMYSGRVYENTKTYIADVWIVRDR